MDPTFGLPERQVVGPSEQVEDDITRRQKYASAARSARYWIENMTTAFTDGDSDEVGRLLNFAPAVIERLDDALNPEQGEEG